jgi:hypothetical protein
MASPTIKLNSGYDMPQVGFGLWKVENDVAADVVYNAIKAGYRLFDGACGEFIVYFYFGPIASVRFIPSRGIVAVFLATLYAFSAPVSHH